MADYFNMFRYDSLENSIVNGITNISAGFTVSDNVRTKAYYISITNDNNNGDLGVRLHLVTNDIITVGPRETLTLNNIAVNGLFLTNSSGVTINYRIQIWGD